MSPQPTRDPGQVASSVGKRHENPKELPPRVLTHADRAKLDKLLADYVKMVQANYVVLAGTDGQFITKQGESGEVDMETVAALAAGAYMVSWQMSRALGKDDFGVVYHEGRRTALQLSQVDDRTVLAVIFDDRATLGMVRLYAKTLTKQLQATLQESARAPRSGDSASLPRHHGPRPRRRLPRPRRARSPRAEPSAAAGPARADQDEDDATHNRTSPSVKSRIRRRASSPPPRSPLDPAGNHVGDDSASSARTTLGPARAGPPAFVSPVIALSPIRG